MPRSRHPHQTCVLTQASAEHGEAASRHRDHNRDRPHTRTPITLAIPHPSVSAACKCMRTARLLRGRGQRGRDAPARVHALGKVGQPAIVRETVIADLSCCASGQRFKLKRGTTATAALCRPRAGATKTRQHNNTAGYHPSPSRPHPSPSPALTRSESASQTNQQLTVPRIDNHDAHNHKNAKRCVR